MLKVDFKYCEKVIVKQDTSGKSGTLSPYVKTLGRRISGNEAAI